MAINPRKIKKKPTPRPAADLKQGNPRDLRNKALREANKMARERTPGPAKDVKAGGARAKFLADAKSGNIKAATPSTSAASKVGLLGKAAKKIPVVGAALGFIADASPAGSAQERSWERRNTEQRRMKGRVSGMGFTGTGNLNPDVPKKNGGGGGRSNTLFFTRADDGKGINRVQGGAGIAAYGGSQNFNPNKKAVGGGPKSRQGSESPTFTKKKAVGGLPPKPKKKPEKKAGATTSAAPATPKRKTNLERMRRRQAERFAVGSSGRSL